MSDAERIAEQIVSSGVQWSEDTIRSYCADDSALSTKVRNLLQQQETGEQLLESLRANFGRCESREFQAGDLVDSYRLESKIGRGGFGVVWLAKRRGDESSVVVKLANSSRDFFDFEVNALRRVNSIAGVAKILDHGVADGLAFLVMEYVPGATLAERLALPGGEGIDSERCRGWINELAQTVSAIHAPPAKRSAKSTDAMKNDLVIPPEGFAHGDITPTNIIIRDDRPVLVDFGAAFEHRIALDNGDTTTSRSVPSRPLCFTPDYRVPEVMYGFGISAAADVYQVGLIAFELLAREKYTVACNRNSENEGFTAIRSAAGTAYEQVIRKCLRWNPAERYSNASQLVKALDLANHLPWRRWAAVAVLSCGMIVATIATDGWLADFNQRSPATPQQPASLTKETNEQWSHWTDDPKQNFEQILLPQWLSLVDFDLSENFAGRVFCRAKGT